MLIHITGAAGSGTSTLAVALANKLGIAHLEADDYFWIPTEPPFTTKRDRAERLSLLLRDLRVKQSAVLAGAVISWGAELENAFDLIVFLYVDAAIRVERLRAREMERFGKSDPAFLEWAAQYDDGGMDGRSLERHQAWLAARTCPVLELRGDLSVGERVEEVVKYMG
jgi:adenylate kinase family enzyme